jgi:two-component system, NtrC family, sensor kinase
LISNLLSFARQTPAMKRMIDLNALINNACQLRMSELPGKISLVRDLQPNLPQVLGDDNHLLQVCLHILNNAVDAVEGVPGAQIVVRTLLCGDHAVMEITDNGAGVAEPLRVFDPFYTTKPLGKGAGLGLSACYGIIQEHDGVIECINLVPRGAMIRISLKVAEKPKVPDSAPTSNNPGAVEITKT